MNGSVEATTTSSGLGADIPSMARGNDCMLRPGNTNCGGCGMTISFSMFSRVLTEEGKRSSVVIPACCAIVAAGGFPTTSFGVPCVAATFAAAPAFAAGIATVRDINQDSAEVVCWAGDGGTYDIGMATLSATAERNDNMIYVCYDNEIYGNTGGQRSSATPPGARTTTTPAGKSEAKKDIISIMAAHGIPYAATLSVGHPEDFRRKVKTALGMEGLRFFLIHSPCPTGWKSEPAESVRLVRLAVESGLFPLYEVFNGRSYRINHEPEWIDPAEYYDRQRRFPKGSIDLEAVQRECRENYHRLKVLAEQFPVQGYPG